MKVRIFLLFCLLMLVFSQIEAVEIKPVSLWITDGCYAMATNGDYLFVGSNDKIYIFEFKDPHLRQIAQCQIDYVVNALFVDGNYLYVADYYIGLSIIDISKITQPKLVGYYCGPAVSHDLWVNGHYAYLAADRYGVNVIDISDPTQPKKVSRIRNFDKTWAVTGRDNYLFMANYYDGLRIIDISDPEKPQQISSFSEIDGEALGLCLNWPYLYNTLGTAGTQIIDVSNPAKPKFLGHCPCYRSANYIYAWGIKVAGDYAFVTDMAGLQIIDVSNPEKPKQVGYCSLMDYGVAIAIEVRQTGNPQEFLVYVGIGGSGLRVLKVRF